MNKGRYIAEWCMDRSVWSASGANDRKSTWKGCSRDLPLICPEVWTQDLDGEPLSLVKDLQLHRILSSLVDFLTTLYRPNQINWVFVRFDRSRLSTVKSPSEVFCTFAILSGQTYACNSIRLLMDDMQYIGLQSLLNLALINTIVYSSNMHQWWIDPNFLTELPPKSFSHLPF